MAKKPPSVKKTRPGALKKSAKLAKQPALAKPKAGAPAALPPKARKPAKTRKVLAMDGVDLIKFKGSKLVVSIKRVRPEVKKKEETAEDRETKVAPLSKRISKEDLKTIKEGLLERRRSLLGTIAAEYEGARESMSATGDEADMASGFAMSDLSLRLAETESRELRDIEDALHKFEDGTYGICEATGKEIEIKRLLKIPQARLCIEAQRQVETEQLRYDEESHAWIMTDEEEEVE
jgi:DnaK suppressor protein